MSVYSYSGTVVDRSTGRGLAGLRVEAWDTELELGGPIGLAFTGSDGTFGMSITAQDLTRLFARRAPEAYFRVVEHVGGEPNNWPVLATTEQTVRWNLGKQRQGGRIRVDPNRPIGVDRDLPCFVVRGRVVDALTGPLEGRPVKIYDVNLDETEDELAASQTIETDANGLFHVAYPISDIVSGKALADLRIKVEPEGGGAPDAETEIRFRTPPMSFFDIVVGGSQHVRSEYGTALAAVLSRISPIALKDLTTTQVDFVRRQANVPEVRVQRLVDAAKLADAHPAVSQEAFFGLLSRGMSATTEGVFGHRIPTLVGTLEAAVESRLIGAAVTADVEALTEALETEAVAALRTVVADRLNLGAVVDDAPNVTPTERTEFLKRVVHNTTSSQAFWAAIDEDVAFSADAREQLRFSMEAAVLSGSFMPVVAQLHARIDGETLTPDPKGLAVYDAVAWRDVIDDIPSGPFCPADTTGASDSEKKDNYAAALARNVEQRYRSAYLKARVAATEPSSDLTTFFTDNPTFEFETTRVERFLVENEAAMDNVDPGDRPALATRLKEIERITRLTRSWAETSAITAAGYGSATAIDQAGREIFKEELSASMEPDRADEIYDRACWTRTATVAIKSKYSWETEKVSTGATPNKFLTLAQNELEEHPSIADWTTLFGSPNACACEHCQSVLGPAAYLADVLQFTKTIKKEPSGNARTVLFARRPDIQRLALSCKNALTALPYVDLVNEILEVLVATSSWPTTPVHVDTTLSTDELLAQPEIVYPEEHIDAYTALEAAVFPFNLPFHLWQEEARIYLTHLGVGRAELLVTFADDGGPTPRDLTLERLGTTGNQLDIITGPPASPPGPEAHEYWGIDEADWPLGTNGLHKARVMMEKAGLSFSELQELLATEYCITQEIAFEADPPCDIAVLEIDGLDTDAKRHFLHRLLRLRRILGWSISDTDKAYTALGATFNTDALAFLGGIRELERLYNVRPVELLAWYAHLDVHNAWAPSLFEEVYLNKRVIAPSDAVFQEIFDAGSPTEVIADVTAGLLAGLRIGAADLALLTEPAAADQALALLPVVGSDQAVTLARLSRLYRVVSFARASRVSIEDLLLVRELSGIVALTGDESSTASPDGTLALRRTFERIEANGLSLEELHYLVRHVAPVGSRLLLTDEDLTAWVEEITELVTKAVEEAAIEMDDPTGSTMVALAGEVLSDPLDVGRVSALAEDPAAMTSPTATAFVEGALAPIIVGAGLTTAEVIARLITDVVASIPEDKRPPRYAYLASILYRFVAVTRLVTEWISDWAAQKFGLENSVENAVTRRILDGRILEWSGTGPAVRVFVPGGTESERKEILVRVQKVALFARKLDLSAEELDALYPEGGPGALPAVDWNEVPIVRVAAAAVTVGERARFELLLRAGELANLRDRWPEGSASLFGVFTLAATGTYAEVRDAIAAGAGWDGDDVAALETPMSLTATMFQSEQVFLRLETALAMVKRLGVPAAMAAGWTDVEAEVPPSFSDAGPNALTIVREIRQAARAKHNDAGWANVARPLRNALRDKQRDALVGYLLLDLDLATPNDLYEKLLIDVEMDPCALTSRIVLAHSSCQQFIQRILMNLEQPDLLPSDRVALQWAWMKNYRVWEANRKVFLWPENWIEPELRDNKTPLFEELEKNLLSGPLDHAAAEDAYRTYLDGLADLSNLEIVAMHLEQSSNNKLKYGTQQPILHVFGRTRKNHKYFYRKRQFGGWSPWERIDADIQGDHLMPFTFGGRLYLSWAVFEDVERVGPSLSEETQAQLEQEIQNLQDQIDALLSPSQGLPSSDDVETLQSLFQQQDKAKAALDVVKEANPPPPLEARVHLETSELRLGTWTPPSQSEPVPLGASPAPKDVSFQTNVGERKVSTRLRVRLREESKESRPLAVFTFYPGTNTHEVLRLGWLSDPTGAYPSKLTWATAGVGADDTAAVPSKTFSEYQAFRCKADSKLLLDLVEGGSADAGAVILDGGITNRTRLITDRVWEPEDEPFMERRQLILQDKQKSFILDLRNEGWPLDDSILAGLFPSISASSLNNDGNRQYRFDLFYHPFINDFRHAVAAGGLDALLRPALQEGDGIQYLDTGDALDEEYDPVAENVVLTTPETRFKEYVDFRHSSAFGNYNWELFFHIPFHIALQLTREGRYEEAQRWFHYIFDPTDGTPGDDVSRYWKLKPFAENQDLAQIQDELENLAMTAYAQEVLQITSGDFDAAEAGELTLEIFAWQRNPFEPHMLARLRPVTYQKAVVMRYIDNLVAWADSLFARDSIESITEASQLYVFALNILGPKPVFIPDPEPHEPQSYKQLDDESAFDAFSNAIVGIEVLAPPLPVQAGHRCGAREPAPDILWGSLYFCVPPNEKLLGYWDTIADRLFKIRNCMNIEGVVRTLPLFEPPIDPALLVRAKAAGVDFASVLNDLSTAAGPYRFSVLSAKATEMASSVASLGATALSAFEKLDAEHLANLRQGHEIATQEAVLATRREQLAEAQQSLRAVERSMELAEERLNYYSSREEVSSAEKSALKLKALGAAHSVTAQALSSAAALVAGVPDISSGTAGLGPLAGVTFGGSNLHNMLSASASGVQATGTHLSAKGDTVGTLASYRRRKDDWNHQAKLASLEIRQLERQIEAARLRVEVARHELAVVQKQIAQSKEVETFLRRKFTNEDLYGWMKGQIASTYHQAYKLAYELAKRAQRAFQLERGDPEQTFIEFGYWDNVKKGLLAGEKLLHDLRRMDAAYLAQNKRELELVKMVSLAEHDPHQLVMLRETGVAELSLTEHDYDRDFSTGGPTDYSSHWLRRFKAVTATVPCTTGPYQGVLATLELLRGETRRPDGTPAGQLDVGTAPVQSICTSQGLQDSGMFELVFRDDRYLPFEGVGAHVSSPEAGPQWRFSLSEGNRFRLDSIDDLVLELRYTARTGRTFTAPSPRTLRRLVRVRRDFPTAWRAFIEGDSSATIELALPMTSWSRARNETLADVTDVAAYVWWTEVPGSPTLVLDPPSSSFTIGGPAVVGAARVWTSSAGSYSFDPAEELWTVQPNTDPEDKAALKDLWIVFDYTVTVS